ncbi:MAG: DNA replication/repair protein RecF [Gammaproteobacteria bacterium]|nr:MAG: DNA replication/repair protein RecF [Gammaproteobacteria bacterium]
MHLNRLRIQAVRILAEVDISPDRTINLISGANGSGKTSLLEAIYLLGRGQSFRARHNRELVSTGADTLRVLGEVDSALGGGPVQVAVERGPSGRILRLGGEVIGSAVHLTETLPLVLLRADVQRVLTDGPGTRRKFMDWAVFHVEQGYGARLKSYRRALGQRNAALRSGKASALEAWDWELAELAVEIHRARDRWFTEWFAKTQALSEQLLGEAPQIRYRAGWDTTKELFGVLAASRGRDQAMGYTGSGPHRGDLHLVLAGKAPDTGLSGGETKLLACAALLGAGVLLTERLGEPPVYLVDDLAAELDARSRSALLEHLALCTAQVFISSLSAEEPRDEWKIAAKRFHVEQGRVRSVV